MVGLFLFTSSELIIYCGLSPANFAGVLLVLLDVWTDWSAENPVYRSVAKHKREWIAEFVA